MRLRHLLCKALIIYLGLASIFTHFVLQNMLKYTSLVYRESMGEVITVENVHAKKGVQAVIAASAFNRLQDIALQREQKSTTGGAYWRQTIVDELKQAGMVDEDARAVAQLVAPYGQLKFDKFLDRSTQQSQLEMREIVAVTNDQQRKNRGLVPAPQLHPTK